jgi:hypothetical protein
VFRCHTAQVRICAGWAGCHDMTQTLGLRVALVQGHLSVEDYETTSDYVSPIPLFASGAEAAAHGMSGIYAADEESIRARVKLLRQRGMIRRL